MKFYLKKNSRTINVAEFNLEGYEMVAHQNIIKNEGRGSLLYIRKDMDFKQLNLFNEQEQFDESIYVDIKLSGTHRLWIVDSKVIKDKEEICNKFNDFFENIGPKLATQFKPVSNKTYDTFLIRRVLMSFSFSLVNENDVLKHLASLHTKNSAGVDGISVKLIKKLSPALINPLTLLINQTLVTGIFPKKLKIAKVLPLFEKDD